MKLPFNISRYIKNYKLHSYFMKSFFLILLILLILFLGVASIFIKSSKDNITSNIKNTNEKMLLNLQNMSNSSLYMALNSGYSFAISPTVITFCNYGNYFSSSSSLSKIYTQIDSTMDMNSMIDSIWIYSKKQNSLITSDNNIQSETKTNQADLIGSIIDTYGTKAGVFHSLKYNIYPHLLSVYIPITTSGIKVIGCIIINFNFESMSKILNISDGNTFYILSDNNFVYSSSSSFNEKIADGTATLDYNYFSDIKTNNVEQFIDNKKLISRCSGNYLNTSFLLITDSNSYANEYNILSSLIIKYFILAVTLALIISLLLITKLSEPFKHLLDLFNSKTELKDYNSEEDFLTEQIMASLQQNDNLQEMLTSRMHLLQDSQIAALQTQINPHFLYNTLEAIKWDAIGLTNSENSTSLSIQQLGKLLRYSLTLNPPFVKISDEKSNLELYLEVENIRFEKKIKLIWECPDELMEYKVPRLILQPIVENSIEHGLRLPSESKIILVRIEHEGNGVLITIKDNGCGIMDDELENLNSKINSTDILAESHIGLVNVSQRIHLLYNSDSYIKVKSTINEGTSVEIFLISI